LVRGPQVMAGYRNMEEENRAVLTHGWLHTGDVATMDEEGYFFIIDRIKDLIVTGGQNVYPREVDEVLHEHPAVLDGCAAGVPHPVLGEVVKAFVVLRKGQVVTDQEIVAFCRERLAKYKVPVEVEFRKSLPRNLVGKVLRRELTKAGNTGEEDT
ncbi:MAG TPA: long-chain fatty acid--CoA ligase, partial [Desulfomicrobiaceae bacterium]|nr:long-chain fatty acid--CoA ligase [Desulfomicrobiaceae bacterium]